MFGVLLKYRIESEVVQMRMIIPLVMVEVDEILDIKMGTNVLYILRED